MYVDKRLLAPTWRRAILRTCCADNLFDVRHMNGINTSFRVWHVLLPQQIVKTLCNLATPTKCWTSACFLLQKHTGKLTPFCDSSKFNNCWGSNTPTDIHFYIKFICTLNILLIWTRLRAPLSFRTGPGHIMVWLFWPKLFQFRLSRSCKVMMSIFTCQHVMWICANSFPQNFMPNTLTAFWDPLLFSVCQGTGACSGVAISWTAAVQQRFARYDRSAVLWRRGQRRYNLRQGPSPLASVPKTNDPIWGSSHLAAVAKDNWFRAVARDAFYQKTEEVL